MNKAAEWLKKERGETSFRDLEEATGLHHMTIAKAEKGDATTDTWIQLAEYFNASVLKVLYLAGKLKSPPTEEELELEFQTRIANNIVNRFSPDEHESILRRIELEAQLKNEREGQKTTHRPRTRNAD